MKGAAQGHDSAVARGGAVVSHRPHATCMPEWHVPETRGLL